MKFLKRILNLLSLLLILSLRDSNCASTTGSVETFQPQPRIPASLLKKGSTGEFIHAYIKPGDRIVGGKPAVNGEFPYQASLQKISFFGSRAHYCGATIISESCLVSAAHCLEGRKSKDIVARLGSNTLRDDPDAEEFQAEKLIIHPQYDSNTILNDIGIIKLKSRINYNALINKVPVADEDEEIPVGNVCIISGWGSTREGSQISKNLMFADVPILSDDSCRTYYGKSEIYDSMICSGFDEGGIDSCQGDSGGPMVCNGKLHGIISWGIGCGVYTQLSHYTKWIKSQEECFGKNGILSKEPPTTWNFTFSLFPLWRDDIINS